MIRSGYMLDVYRAHLKTALAVHLQYRAMVLIWLIGLVLEPVIYLVVWKTVARSQPGDVGGYNAGEFAAYFLVLMLVNQLTFSWVMEEAEWRVREGQLSPLLLRPVHPIHHDIGFNLSYKLLTLVVLLPIAIGLGWLFDASFSPPGWAVLVFIPALVLSYIMRFLIDWSVSLVTFWVTRMAAISQMYLVVTIFLTGQIAPLSLFPAPVRWLASILPFRWMVAFPVELLLGRVSPEDAMIGLGMQALWLVLGLLMMRWMWREGTRRYSAVGA